MKVSWLFLSDSPDVEVMPEHRIYEKLHCLQNPNIPEHVAGGEADGGRTQTQELVDAPWLCARPRISPYQRYRLVHEIVGERFSSSNVRTSLSQLSLMYFKVRLL
jgi:hypothetical protein